MMAIYKRELRLCFGMGVGYLVVCALLLLSGLSTFLNHFVAASTDFSAVVLRMEWGLIVAVPLLSMCSFARERREGTERCLAAQPISTAAVVLGKFGAVSSVFAIPTAVTALYPMILHSIGEISLVTAYAALLGYLLLGLFLIALGMLISSLCRHEAVAGGVMLALLLALYFLPKLAEILPLPWLSNLLVQANPFAILSGFAYGYFDLTGVFYYLSATAFCLLLTALSYVCRRVFGEGVRA